MYKEEKYFDNEKLLDEALKAEPQFILPDNFADVLAKKMGRRLALEQYIREFLLYIGIIFGLLMVPVVIKLVLFDASVLKWSEVVTANITLLLGIIFLLVFILFADRVILRYLFYKNSTKAF